jgi:hypothetical protein
MPRRLLPTRPLLLRQRQRLKLLRLSMLLLRLKLPLRLNPIDFLNQTINN